MNLCNPTKGTLVAEQKAADANDQDDTSESSQPDQPPLPPKTYQKN